MTLLEKCVEAAQELKHLAAQKGEPDRYADVIRLMMSLEKAGRDAERGQRKRKMQLKGVKGKGGTFYME